MKKLYLIAFLALTIASCKKDDSNEPQPAGTGLPVTIKVDQETPGYAIAPDFEGLSYETLLLALNPNYLNVSNTALLNLIKNLGPGILRIGGNTSDQVTWTGGERTNATPDYSLTTTDIKRLSAFSAATGWKVLFGLNLAENNITNAVAEAGYVSDQLKDNLYLLQFGNEPDVFNLYTYRSKSYNYDAFKIEWTDHYNAVKNRYPQLNFAGPDISYNSDWFKSFAADFYTKVNLLDGHHYNNGPATKESINYHTILAKSFLFDGYLQKLWQASQQYGVPYRITECNSVYGGGKPGASNVFAASLWALDMMWMVAQKNGKGVNFHGGDGLFYSPVADKNGTMVPGPVYYSMLAFKYAGTGAKILGTTVIDERNLNCSSYATTNADKSWSVTLINKEEKADISFTVQLTRNASAVQVARLTAPSLTTADNITFAGSTVAADGTFTPAPGEQLTVKNKSFLVNVKAGSAVVITVK